MSAREKVNGFVRALLEPARESPGSAAPQATRRRIVCLVVLLIGALTLRWSLSIEAGDPLFYPGTAALALIWLLGARASGPVALGRSRTLTGQGTSNGVGQALAWGALLLAVFLAGAVVVSRIPVLAGPVQDLLDHARQGSLPLVAVLTAVNGIGEECFFRGALFDAVRRRWGVVLTTVAYTIVTACSGIALLALAAAMLGALTGLQRRATGGVLAPVVTHLVWSLGMLVLLPGTLDLGAALLG